jgi:hypothetical protein
VSRRRTRAVRSGGWPESWPALFASIGERGWMYFTKIALFMMIITACLTLICLLGNQVALYIIGIMR